MEGQSLKLSEDKYYVFSGNSAVECSVDDGLIKHSVNIAQSGEAYLYSYSKLKALLNANDHIKTVFISFSYGDLLIEKELSWLFSNEFVVEKIQHYNYLLDLPEKTLILKNNPQAYFLGLTKSIYKNAILVLSNFSTGSPAGKLVNFGGYKYLVRDKLEADPGNYVNQKADFEKSSLQEKYLKMISDLCRQHSVTLVLFNPPKYKSYNKNLDMGIWNLWFEVRNSLPGDSLLDLSGYVLPDSCYGDLSHLNYKGARIFSQYLNEQLNPPVIAE